MAMGVVQTDNLTKNFGKFTALEGVNLEVNPGEVYGFIGPNGAGKTTTIRILRGRYVSSGWSGHVDCSCGSHGGTPSY